MTTRQEQYTAIGVIRQTCRLNGHVFGLANILNYTGLYSAEESFLDFDAQKVAALNLANFMTEHAPKINIVLQNVDPIFLDNGFGYIPVVADRLKTTSDIQAVNNLTTIAIPLITTVEAKESLALLSPSFKNYISKCGVVEPDPWAIIETEANNANILQDVIEAMSYELQGKNSYTGQPHGASVESIKKLMSNRIYTGWIYHAQLTDNLEPVGNPSKALMGIVLSYMEKELVTANTLSELETLGQFIDTEMPDKLKIVRRWWAL